MRAKREIEELGPALTPLSSARSLGAATAFKPSRPAPEQAKAKFDAQAPEVIIRQVGKAFADFRDGTIDRIPGRMRKRMIGDQFSERYRARTDKVKEAITLWSVQTGTPLDWIDKAFQDALGWATVTQDEYAPILNPLAEPATGAPYRQLRSREFADDLFGSGHVSYDEIGWTKHHEQAARLSSSRKHHSFAQAHPDYSVVEVNDALEIVRGEVVVGTLSAVPWSQYDEWLNDLDMSAFYDEVGKAPVNATLRGSLLIAMCAHRDVYLNIGGWVLMQELAQSRNLTEDELFRDLLATERGYFEFVAWNVEGAEPGERWSPPITVRGNTGTEMQSWINRLRRGFLFPPSMFWAEACHCLCHPTHDDSETIRWEGIRPGNRGNARHSSPYGTRGPNFCRRPPPPPSDCGTTLPTP